jgi:hypothetical protein
MKKSMIIFASLAFAVLNLNYSNSNAQIGVKTYSQPQKKEQSVKVVIRKDGQLIEKDTIVTGDSKNFTYITKKMTVAADSLYHSIGDDLTGKMVTVTVFDDNGDKGKGSKTSTHTYTYTIGDSLQKNGTQKLVRKIEGRPLIIMENGEGKTFDLTDSPTTVANQIMMHKVRDPFAFDPTDPTIVSYQKKDVGKDKEKITIVRKKAIQVK